MPSGPALSQITQAKAVCRRCPAMSECLSLGLETIDAGVWGGASGASAARSDGHGVRVDAQA